MTMFSQLGSRGGYGSSGPFIPSFPGGGGGSGGSGYGVYQLPGGYTGGSSTGSGSGATGPVSVDLKATPDPNSMDIFERMRNRSGSPYTVDPWLAKQFSEDHTKELVDRSAGMITDSLAGEKARAAEEEARGGKATDPRLLEEAAQRRKAGVATDITLGRAAAKDSLATAGAGFRLQDAGQKNALLAGAGTVAGQVASNQLDQQRLQAQIAADQQRAAQAQASQMMQIFSSLYA